MVKVNYFFNLWYWRSGCNGKVPYLSEIMIFYGYMTQVSDNSMHRHLMILFMCLLSFAKILPRTIKRWKISQFSMHDESVTTFDNIYLIFLIVLFCLFFRFIYKLRKKNRKKKGQSIIIIYCFASLETKTKYKNQVQT